MKNESAVTASRVRIALALATVYVVWGSTYFAIRIALRGFPALLMPGLRYAIAGAVLFAVLRARGEKGPSRREWAACLLMGVLMLTFGNGGVTVAEQWVASGLAAIMIASVPVWSAIFSTFFGKPPSRLSLFGLLVGTAGVLLLNFGADLRGHPWGAALLVLASASWAFGTVISPRLSLPKGLMASSAQMLCGGGVLLLGALLHGEKVTSLSPAPVLALAYLVVFGSLIAYSAYSFLMRTVSASVATSYAFVNPLIAVLLGCAFGGESFGVHSAVAMAAILVGVFIVLRGRVTPTSAPAPAARAPQRV